MEDSRPCSTKHLLPLVGTWVVVSAALVAMLLMDVRRTDQLQGIRHALHACYVAALLWYLGRCGPSLSRLTEVGPASPPRGRFGPWIPAIFLALVFLLTLFSDDGVDILLLLMLVATGWILLAWRKGIRLGMVVQGLLLAAMAYLVSRPMTANGFVGETTALLLAVFAAPMYVAGGLLLERTRFGGGQLLSGRYGGALASFLRGCILFLPLGLINAADGSPGEGITWVNEAWMTFTLPWFSGLAEETWFRLLLMGLCFFLLRPALKGRPGLAVVAVVLFSGITFGVGHGRTLERFLTTGLLYGVPMAAVFARRDFEHAVGAHYMVNYIPWVMVFLKA
jgi:hypothetical protein